MDELLTAVAAGNLTLASTLVKDVERLFMSERATANARQRSIDQLNAELEFERRIVEAAVARVARL
jgi:hypothetical protein